MRAPDAIDTWVIESRAIELHEESCRRREILAEWWAPGVNRSYYRRMARLEFQQIGDIL